MPFSHTKLKTKTSVIQLDCGDKLVLAENTPLTWHTGKRICLLIHGLSGCQNSTYMVRVANKLCNEGFNTIRLNMRGAGPGLGLSRDISHAGNSPDILKTIEWLAKRYPSSPITLIGFSLGGGIALNMLGQFAYQNSRRLDSCVVVSAPLCFIKTTRKLLAPDNDFFHKYYLKGILHHIHSHYDKHPHLRAPDLSKVKSIVDFDDIYTAPRNHFDDAHSYYRAMSPVNTLQNISIKTIFIVAMDDPVVDVSDLHLLKRNPFIKLVAPDNGGHLGFIGSSPLRWMDAGLVHYVREFDGQVFDPRQSDHQSTFPAQISSSPLKARPTQKSY